MKSKQAFDHSSAAGRENFLEFLTGMGKFFSSTNLSFSRKAQKFFIRTPSEKLMKNSFEFFEKKNPLGRFEASDEFGGKLLKKLEV